MDVKMETQKATSGGIKIEVSTWENGNLNTRKSIQPPNQWKSWIIYLGFRENLSAELSGGFRLGNLLCGHFDVQ
jgi:hypothetical protein